MESEEEKAKLVRKSLKLNQMPTHNSPEKPKGPPVFVKYIGLSFQLFGVIGAGTWFGWWVQQQSEMKFPVWLLLFCFLSIIIAFYQLWKSMQRDN